MATGPGSHLYRAARSGSPVGRYAGAHCSSRCLRRPRNGGFTLIEVIIAIVILAASVTTLYGLQAANSRVTLHISGENRAMLLARQFFAMLEARPENAPPLGEQSAQGTMEEVYNALQMKPPLFSGEALSRYRVSVTIDRWPLGELLPRPIRRLQLSIAWGATSYDRLVLTYFLPPDSSAE